MNNKDLNKLEYAFKLINEMEDDFVIDEIICDAIENDLDIDYLDDCFDLNDPNKDYITEDLDYLDYCFDLNSYDYDIDSYYEDDNYMDYYE